MNVFQTLDKLELYLNRTSKEFHCGYDTDGRLVLAVFAQTPQSGQTGRSSQPAAARARVYYVYDAGRRTDSLAYYWDTWSASNNSYSSVPIFANNCSYELSTTSPPSASAFNRGVKLANSFSVGQSGNWVLDHSDSFGYDANYDYLTSASYGDGQANPNQSWTYDPAGNRSISGYSYDNLNRMLTAPSPGTGIGSVSYVNDILGNRLTQSASGETTTTYTWDALNGLTNVNGNSAAAYEYRSDGLRSAKSVTSSGVTTTDSYRYDGQMPFEDETISGSTVNGVRSALGPRGIDAVEAATGTISSGTLTVGATSISYPIYDAHGNRICGLSRYNTNYYTTDTPRYYGAWGEIRKGAATGGPTSRHCGNLGHVQDDESGLAYMRARYYDSSTGRFVNQDPSKNGQNWYAYCSNDPLNYVDSTGHVSVKVGSELTFEVILSLSAVAAIGAGFAMRAGNAALALSLLVVATFCATFAMGSCTTIGVWTQCCLAVPDLMVLLIGSAVSASLLESNAMTYMVGAACIAETLMVTTLLIDIEFDPDNSAMP